MIEWTPGSRHPETNATIFRNVWQMDTLRRVFKGRCPGCGYVISPSSITNREAIFKCDDKSCRCHTPMGSQVHEVCDLCYWMIRALYSNVLLKNMNYFKDIDEREENQRRNRNNRMGLE